jgi:hypothetical protein
MKKCDVCKQYTNDLYVFVIRNGRHEDTVQARILDKWQLFRQTRVPMEKWVCMQCLTKITDNVSMLNLTRPN